MSTKLFDTIEAITANIPFTDNLTINRAGDIKDKNSALLLKFKKPNGYWVNLPIIKEDGSEASLTIKVATLTSIVFKEYGLPWNWWTQIELFFKDDNCFNVDPSNIAHKQYPKHFKYTFEEIAYKVIPNYTRYGISHKGVIYNSTNDRLSYGSKDTDGYTIFDIYCDVKGTQASLNRHRALGLCYPIGKNLDDVYGKNVDTSHVNHIDHIPSSDELTNLEWCSQSENQLHSIYHGGFREACANKLVVYDLRDQQLHIFPSMKYGARKLGYVTNNLNKNIKENSYPILQKHFRFTYFKEGELYDMNHPIVTTKPTLSDYMLQGTIHVVKDDREIWNGYMFPNLIKDLNLPYPDRNSAPKKFKRGKNPLIPGHVVYIALDSFPSYYGGDVYK